MLVFVFPADVFTKEIHEKLIETFGFTVTMLEVENVKNCGTGVFLSSNEMISRPPAERPAEH